MRRRLYTLDVFTNRPFAGNPLAVVLLGTLATLTWKVVATLRQLTTLLASSPAGG